MGITYIVAVHIHILPNIPLWVKLMYNQLWSIHIYFCFIFYSIFIYFYLLKDGTHSFVKLHSQNHKHIFLCCCFYFMGSMNHSGLWYYIEIYSTQNFWGVCVAWQIYGDLLVILGSPRVTYYTGYMFYFSVNISSIYHIKSSVKVV